MINSEELKWIYRFAAFGFWVAVAIILFGLGYGIYELIIWVF